MMNSSLESQDQTVNDDNGVIPLASSTPVTSPSGPSSGGGQGHQETVTDIERSEVVTFDSRKSVKRLTQHATVSKFRQNFEK